MCDLDSGITRNATKPSAHQYRYLVLYSFHALWRVHLNDVVLGGLEGSYHGCLTSFALNLDIASAVTKAGDYISAVDAMP